MDNRLKLRRSLSEGLSSWLSYERHCGREGLFSERYLALPIAQILSNNFNGQIEAEHNHPVLTKKGKAGRPLQLDFVIRDKKDITLVVESKWVGNSNISVVDIIWDCVRLELAAHHYGCDALFILAGQRDRIDKLLNSKPYNPNTKKGKPSPILGLNGNGRFSVNIQSPKRDFGPALHKYLKQFDDVFYPRSFICGTGLQIPKEAASTSLSAAIWHIKPEEGVKRFPFKA